MNLADFLLLGQNLSFWPKKNEKKQHKHDKLLFYAYKFISTQTMTEIHKLFGLVQRTMVKVTISTFQQSAEIAIPDNL